MNVKRCPDHQKLWAAHETRPLFQAPQALAGEPGQRNRLATSGEANALGAEERRAAHALTPPIRRRDFHPGPKPGTSSGIRHARVVGFSPGR